MTGQTGLAVTRDGGGNGTTPKGFRLANGGTLAKQTTGLDVRKGVMFDGGGAVVTGQATMNYAIRAHVAVVMPSAAQGPVLVANDAQVLVATGAAPGSNSRIDIIWVRQHLLATDGGADLDVVAEYGVTQGATAAVPVAPAIPTGAVELARATVGVGVTQTNSLTIQQTHNWCAAAGAPIPVRDNTDRAALTAFSGLIVNNLTSGALERYDGAAWETLAKSQVLAPDGGFPISFSGVTTTQVLFRWTIPAETYARKIAATVGSFLGYSQANDIELGLFAGATNIGRNQQRMTGTNGTSFVVTGSVDLAAGASLVLEARVTRVAGTGTMSNSAGTYNSASVIACPA